MPLDIAGVVDQMISENQFQNLVNNPAGQFGIAPRAYLGALILPEQPRDENFFEEAGIRYRSIVANDGTRYSPVQLKSGVLTGTFEVRLGYQDTGSHFTSRDYDTFIKLLRLANKNTDIPAMQAMTNLLRWADTQLNIPMREVIEKQRWQGLVDASIVRVGDNGYQETVTISNPTGHRVASSDWSNSAIDPLTDIVERVNFLRRKGYSVSRIVTSYAVLNLLLAHPKVLARLGILSIIGGVIVGQATIADAGQLNAYMARNSLPAIQTYDLQYQTDTGSVRFLKDDVMVFVAATGRDEQLILGPDVAPVVLPNTLGYVAVGVPAGQQSPGRVVKVRAIMDSKPPRIEGETWQASFPVIAEPEAVATLYDIPIP